MENHILQSLNSTCGKRERDIAGGVARQQTSYLCLTRTFDVNVGVLAPARIHNRGCDLVRIKKMADFMG
ncbi:MAG: hypothetical protein ACOX19_07175 [Fermentimonas sp.]|jgi:hypothetical protein